MDVPNQGRAWKCKKGENLKQENKKKYEHEKKVNKGVRGMPWLSEAKKDVISCEKLWVGANNR